MNIIIPLCGKGERFLKQGFNKPKPLIKVLDKELLSYTLDCLNITKDDNVYIIYHISLDNYGFHKFINNKYPNITLIKLDNYTSGAAETIYLGCLSIDNYFDKCLLLDGDTFYHCDILKKARECTTNGVFFFKNIGIDPKYSYINFNDYGLIYDIKEKEKISDNANTGAYLFDNIDKLMKYCKHIIDKNIRFKNEYYTSCVIKQMINNGYKFKAIEIDKNDIVSLGTPEQVDNYLNCYLFDLDGTLILTDHIYFKVWAIILKEYHITLTDEIFNNYIKGKNDILAIRYLLPNCMNIANTISTKKDAIFHEFIDEIIIIDGAIEYIENLITNNYKVCIVTNCNRITAEQILTKMNLLDKISGLIIGSECTKPKPYPDPYNTAIKLMKSHHNCAIIFEDSQAGILSARGVFPKCLVGIDTSISTKELYELGVNRVIHNYKNINLNHSMINLVENISEMVTNTLSYNYNIKNVQIDNNKLKGGYIADVIKANIKLDDTNNNEFTCVIKMENTMPSMLRDVAIELELYEREYYFYESISSIINSNILCIPKYYGLLRNEDFKPIGIILENLDTDEFKLGLDLNKESIDVALGVISCISCFHATFWNKDIQKSFPNLRKNNDNKFCPKWQNFINDRWIDFREKWSNVLSNTQIDIGNKIVEKFTAIQQKLSQGQLTICHGDVKSGNIFYKICKNNYIPHFIDWQYIIHGKGVQDLVFFMIESFEKEIMDTYYTIFKQYYYIKLLEYDVANYSYDEYENDFKLAICYYPFFVAIWFGTTPEKDLIDVNFPFFYIQKLFRFIENNITLGFLENI